MQDEGTSRADTSESGSAGTRGSGAQEVVVFEPNHGGHRLDYVAWLASHCREQGIAMTLAMCSNGLASDDLMAREALGPLRSQAIDLGPLPPADQPGYVPWLLGQLVALRRSRSTAHLVVLEGDWILPGLLRSPLGRDTDLTVLVMRMPRSLAAAVRTGPKDAAKLILARLARRRGADVKALVPTPPQAGAYERGGVPGVPDAVDIAPASSLAEAARAFELDPERRWFGLFGHITQRKNLGLVAEALTAVDRPGATGLLVAGRVPEEDLAEAAEVLAAYEAAGGRLLMMDRFLTAPELDAAISAADVAVLAHSADGPSGILGKAGALGTHVVAAGAPTLRDYLQDHPTVGVWCPLDRASLVNAFEAAIARAATGSRPGAANLAGPGDFARSLLARKGARRWPAQR